MRLHSNYYKLFMVAFLSISPILLFAEDEEKPGISSSGVNVLQFNRGEKYDGNEYINWDYFTDALDFDLGIQHFFFNGRLSAELPNSALGDASTDYFYRNYLKKRTIGFNYDPVTLQAGHILTTFGKGLTLNLQEDIEFGRSNILDGVMLEFRKPWLSLQVVGGRPSKPDVVLVGKIVGNDTSYIQTPQISYRDLIIGGYAETFPFSKLESIAGSSIGVGVVYYKWGVSPRFSKTRDSVGLYFNSSTNTNVVIDTTKLPVGTFENRTESFVPSLDITLSTPIVDFSTEQAWFITSKYAYTDTLVTSHLNGIERVNDSVPYYDQEKINSPVSYAKYMSLATSLYNLYLQVEYKNYYTTRTSNDYVNIEGYAINDNSYLSKYIDPPKAAYIHKWQLLNKHMTNLATDILGYNVSATWSQFENTKITAASSFGGIHDSDKVLKYSSKTNYWDLYGEVEQDINEWFNYKLGLDYGVLEQEQPTKLNRTVGMKLNYGPFNDRHSIAILGEYQLASKWYHAEKDSVSAMQLIKQFSPLATNLDSYRELPASSKSRSTVWANNYLLNVSYSFSPYVIVSLNYEHEVKIPKGEKDEKTLISQVELVTENYPSIALNVTPVQNHTVRLEYGSFSGGMKCTLGSCVVIPSWRGFRFSINSTF